MAKIEECLKQILSARYGRDVRQSIHDAISAINDESTECWATVEKVPETLAIAAVKDTVSGKDITLEMSSDFVLTDFKAWGNNEQDTTTGKNLLNNTATTQTKTGVTFTKNSDGTISLNGTATEATAYRINPSFNFKANESYILSGCPSGGAEGKYFMYLGNDSSIKDYGNGRNITYTEDVTDTVYFIVYSGVNVNGLVIKPMIRLASITDATYEPYTNGASPNPKYSQEIKSVVISEIRTCGKNLLKYSALLYGGISSEDGYTLLSSTSILYAPYFTQVKRGESYIFNVSQGARIYKYDANKKFIESVIVNGAFVADCEYIRYQSSYFTEESQLELGTVSTPFEPYTESVVTLSEPITLNGIDGVRDNLDGKKFKEVVFDGSDDEWWFASTALAGRYITSIPDVKLNSKALCTQAKNGNNGTKVVNEFYVSGSSAEFVINTSFATLDEWKAHLASKPMKVTYELADPIETPLPDADVEALKNIRTFKGITHVFTDSEVKPDMEVEYVIDTKMYIDKKIAELA